MALVAINIIADVPEPEFTEDAIRDFVAGIYEAKGRIYDATFVVLAGEGKRVNLQES